MSFLRIFALVVLTFLSTSIDSIAQVTRTQALTQYEALARRHFPGVRGQTCTEQLDSFANHVLETSRGNDVESNRNIRPLSSLCDDFGFPIAHPNLKRCLLGPNYPTDCMVPSYLAGFSHPDYQACVNLIDAGSPERNTWSLRECLYPQVLRRVSNPLFAECVRDLTYRTQNYSNLPLLHCALAIRHHTYSHGWAEACKESFRSAGDVNFVDSCLRSVGSPSVLLGQFNEPTEGAEFPVIMRFAPGDDNGAAARQRWAALRMCRARLGENSFSSCSRILSPRHFEGHTFSNENFQACLVNKCNRSVRVPVSNENNLYEVLAANRRLISCCVRPVSTVPTTPPSDIPSVQAD